MNKLPTFIDLFAGCGGLSLGLLQAGWKGLFAIEKSSDALKTYMHNFGDESALLERNLHYEWIKELKPVKHNGNWVGEDITNLTSKFGVGWLTEKLQGKVDLVAGGPPCQGFSMAGKRDVNDPRNQLVKSYIRLVKLIQPRYILIENVEGIKYSRQPRGSKTGKTVRLPQSYVEYIETTLGNLHGKGARNSLNYTVKHEIVRSVRFGVPQYRPRFILVGIRNDIYEKLGDREFSFFNLLTERRKEFLKSKGLPTNKFIWVSEAIGDLKVAQTRSSYETAKNRRLVNCEGHIGFKQIEYKEPRRLNPYLKLMRNGMNGSPPSSLRLPRHRPETEKNFREIQEICKEEKRLGVQISNDLRKERGIKKQCLVPLHPKKPSHTITTIPDDLIHYSEPRVHTVREQARLQSFPDWFEFKGKYTTGGHRRVIECPRYTQVGNAVPPLLAEALGKTLLEIHNKQEANGNNSVKSLDSQEAKMRYLDAYSKGENCKQELNG